MDEKKYKIRGLTFDHEGRLMHVEFGSGPDQHEKMTQWEAMTHIVRVKILTLNKHH